jgi:peptidoglycan/xylan/chitin deacetylase (PgdA/CDA1 family)
MGSVFNMRIIIKFLKWLSSPIITRTKKGAYVYLTFDDGPHPVNTPKLLDILDHHNVKATFFMVGKEIESHPEIVQSIFQSGHSIGYHSYDHCHAKEAGFFKVYRELGEALSLEKKYGFTFNKLYRPPYGALTLKTLIAIIARRWKIILWSKDSMDSYVNQDQVVDNLSASNINVGDIVLLHDDYKTTSSTIDLVLAKYNSTNIICRNL